MAFSELTLYRGVILDPRMEHTIFWRNSAEKNAYFGGRVAKATAQYTFLRKDNAIVVPFHVDDLEGDINYCMVNNEGNQYFYFIHSKEFVNNSATRLHVQLDVIQTYQDKMVIPSCFVEREHVIDDSIGKNLVEEGLETGEFVINSGKFLAELTELAVVVQSAVTLENPVGEPVEGAYIGGVYSGYKLYCASANELGRLKINAVLKSLDTQGKSDGVASMWMYPKQLIVADWDHEDDVVMLPVLELAPMTISSTMSNNLDGYIPHNNKLLTYPYKFINLSNMEGGSGILRYELFDNLTPKYAVFGSIGVDGVVRLIPQNYRGFANDHESGISLTGFPTCAWTQDAYKIWLAQNANSQDLAIQSGWVSVGIGAGQAAAGVGMSAGGLFTGGGDQMIANGASMIYSGYQQIAGVMASRADKAVTPPQAKGAQSSNVNIAWDNHSFNITNMSIQAEFARRIDAFFDMYGYKVNTVKAPNLNTRMLWNYVKTIGCVVLGDIDSKDRQQIAAIFDKGITLWHDPASMYDYSTAAQNINIA